MVSPASNLLEPKRLKNALVDHIGKSIFIGPHFPIHCTFSLTTSPRAITTHRQSVDGIHRTILAQGLQDRLDKAVAGVAGQAFAVGAEVRQFAAAVPDRYGGAGGDLLGAWEEFEGFEVAQGAGQLALAAGLLHRVELHALWPVVLEQFGEVLLITDVAGAGRVPEMHHANRPGAGQVLGKAQGVTGKHRRVRTEGPQVASLEPVIGRPQDAGA